MSTRLRYAQQRPPRELSDLDQRDGIAIPQTLVDLQERPIVIAPSRYVLLPLAALITGYTVKAMQRKIERNDWRELREYRRAPDGHLVLDVTGYENWVVSGQRIRR